jgi:hypothetical protein
MGIHSGKFGVVNGRSHIRNWSLEDSIQPEVYYASNTKFGAFRNSGVEDWTGGFEGFGGEPPVLPGANLAFSGYTAPDNDIVGGQGKIYAGAFIVNAVTVNWNWQPTQTLNWTAEIARRTGAVTISDSVHEDTAVTLPQKMCGLKIQIGDAGAEEDWENVVQATFNITADNQTYVNSSTSCRTYRKAGNIDWTLSVVEQNEAQDLTKGSFYRILLFTTNSLYWELEWGIFTGYTGFVIDRETGAIIQKTANFAMSGSDGTSIGSIVTPSGSTFWPESGSGS